MTKIFATKKGQRKGWPIRELKLNKVTWVPPLPMQRYILQTFLISPKIHQMACLLFGLLSQKTNNVL